MNINARNPATVALLGLNVLLAMYVFWLSERPTQHFVLTPFYQVVPRGSVWTAEELAKIQAEMPSALEARDMHKAYARLGSTLSIDDVLKGIDGLEDSAVPLTETQHAKIQEAISNLQADHQKMRQVQRELIQLENRLVQQTRTWGVLP